jgi:hypothetical protein
MSAREDTMDELQTRVERILDAYFQRSSLNLATGGQVTAEAFQEFLKTTGAEGTPLLNSIRAAGGFLIRNGDPIKIPTLGLASRQLQKATKGTAPASVANFTTGEASISTTEVIYPVDLDYQDFEDAIGRMPGELGEEAANAYLDQVTGDLVMAAIARDLQDLLINGDTGSGTTFLQTFDGIIKAVTVGGTKYNPGTSQTIKEFLNGLYGTASANIKAAKSQLAIWLAPGDFADLWDLYDQRNTTLGDAALTLDQEGGLRYHGVPVYECDHLPPQKALLAKNNFCFIGFRRNWSVEKQRQPRKRILEITVTARVGHAEVLDYVILGTRTP